MREGDQLTIIVGLKCIGEVKQDIDLVCLGTFSRGLPIKVKSDNGKRKPARLVNLALIVEVKNHSPDSIDVDGGHVKVKYSCGWSDATEQLQGY